VLYSNSTHLCYFFLTERFLNHKGVLNFVKREKALCLNLNPSLLSKICRKAHFLYKDVFFIVLFSSFMLMLRKDDVIIPIFFCLNMSVFLLNQVVPQDMWGPWKQWLCHIQLALSMFSPVHNKYLVINRCLLNK
jgi:hypothetical protein